MARPESVRSRRGVAANLIRIDGGLRACNTVSFGDLDLAPCAKLLLEHLSARGDGVHVAARTTRATWVALGLGARARFRLSGAIGLVGGGDVQWQTARPRIVVEGLGNAGQLGVVAPTFVVGCQWIW